MNIVNKIIKGAIILVAMLMVNGCSKFYSVEATYVQESMKVENSQPEIVKTKEYTKVINSVDTIAVAAPERCKNETASAAAGKSLGKDIIIKRT